PVFPGSQSQSRNCPERGICRGRPARRHRLSRLAAPHRGAGDEPRDVDAIGRTDLTKSRFVNHCAGARGPSLPRGGERGPLAGIDDRGKVRLQGLGRADRAQPSRMDGMTWSIIAREQETGRFGIAVSTRFFAVGALVPYVKSGIGAIATQALTNPFYGIDGLRLLEAGKAAPEVVSALTAADSGREHRQLHAIDAQGRIAA